MLSALADNTPSITTFLCYYFFFFSFSYLFCSVANYMQIILFTVHLHFTSKTNPLVLPFLDFTFDLSFPQFF